MLAHIGPKLADLCCSCTPRGHDVPEDGSVVDVGKQLRGRHGALCSTPAAVTDMRIRLALGADLEDALGIFQ